MGWLRVMLALAAGLLLLCGGFALAHHALTYALTSPPASTQQSSFTERGIASWYGREEQGGGTASGERFDRHAMTAASLHLPMNTVVRVTNETNGRSVQVRINDRGPYIHGRILDLSEAAADSLDMKKSGTAPVKIDVIPASAQAASAP